MAKDTPLEALEQKHLRDSAERRERIEAASKDVRDATAMLVEAKDKVRRLQADHINASFAYDAERARLAAEAAKAAAA